MSGHPAGDPLFGTVDHVGDACVLAVTRCRDDPTQRVVLVVDGNLAAVAARQRLGQLGGGSVDVATVTEAVADQLPMSDATVIIAPTGWRKTVSSVRSGDVQALAKLLRGAREVVMVTPPPDPKPVSLQAMRDGSAGDATLARFRSRFTVPTAAPAAPSARGAGR